MRYCGTYRSGDLHSVAAGVVSDFNQVVYGAIDCPYSKGFRLLKLTHAIFTFDCQNNVLLGEMSLQIQLEFDYSNTIINGSRPNNPSATGEHYDVAIRPGQTVVLPLNTEIMPNSAGFAADMFGVRYTSQFHLLDPTTENFNVGYCVTYIGELS